jgi:hypothetical protein
MIPKKIKYKVLSACGDADVGDILDGFLIFKSTSNGVAIIFLPKNGPYSCGCLIMCRKNHGNYEEINQESYINLTNQDNKLIDSLCK